MSFLKQFVLCFLVVLCDVYSNNITCSNNKCILDCNRDRYLNCNNLTVYANHTKDIEMTCDSRETMICSNITIYAEYARNINFYVSNNQHRTWRSYISTVNVVIYAANSENISITCWGEAACINFQVHAEYCSNFQLKASGNHDTLKVSNIYVDNAEYVNINCIDSKDSDNSSPCNNVNIYASNANNVDISCDSNMINQHDPACELMDVFAENVTNINIGSALRFININVNNAKNINIYTDLRIGMKESVIYAANIENKMNISCFGGFGGIICDNLNIYLPITESVIYVLCEGIACQNTQFYIEDNMNISSVINIEINGCDLCDDRTECINIEQLQYYDNNDNIKVSYKQNVFECQPNVPDTVLITRNNKVYWIGFAIFCASTVCLLCIMMMMMIKCFYIKWKQRNQKIKWFSSRPHIFILWYSFIIDPIVYFSILWWGLKISMMKTSFTPFCSAKYEDVLYTEYCIENVFCDPWKSGHPNINYCDDGIDTDCKCKASKGLNGIMITFWIQYSLITLWQFIFWIIACKSKQLFSNPRDCKYYSDGLLSHFACCSLCCSLCCKSTSI